MKTIIIDGIKYDLIPHKKKTTGILPKCLGATEFIYAEKREKEVKEMIKGLNRKNSKSGELGCKDNCIDYPDCHPTCRARWYYD